MRVGGDGLLQEPVEEHAAGGGSPTVESEGVLVEVVGQVFSADAEVVSAGVPPFEQGRDAVWTGQRDVAGFR